MDNEAICNDIDEAFRAALEDEEDSGLMEDESSSTYASTVYANLMRYCSENSGNSTDGASQVECLSAGSISKLRAYFLGAVVFMTVIIIIIFIKYNL